MRRRETIKSLRVLLVAYFALSWIPPCCALGPATNPLNLLTRYEVAWVDPSTETFGGNFTFFRPINDPAAAGWALMFRFPDEKAIVTSFHQKNKWTVAKDNAGRFLALANDESSDADNSAVAAMDAAIGVRRFNLLFHASVTASAILTNLMPIDYALVLADAPTPFPLVVEKDTVNMPVRADVPRQPFGPYLEGIFSENTDSQTSGTRSPSKSPALAADDTEPDNPSPRGTDFVASPVGFSLFLAVFGVAGSFFAVGTLDRALSSRRFFRELKTGIPVPDVSRRNVFLDV